MLKLILYYGFFFATTAFLLLELAIPFMIIRNWYLGARLKTQLKSKARRERWITTINGPGFE